MSAVRLNNPLSETRAAAAEAVRGSVGVPIEGIDVGVAIVGVGVAIVGVGAKV